MTRAGTIPLSEIERIRIYSNKKRYTETKLATILKKTGGDFLFNGTIFSWNTFKPLCHMKADGSVYCKPNYSAYGMAWNVPDDYGMAVLPCDKSNYITCVPLIVKSKKINKPNYQDDMGGARPRTAIGGKDGKFAYYVTSAGYTPEKLRDLLYASGWDSAVMLDGGGSTCFRDKASGFCCGKDRADQNFIVVYLKHTDNETKGDKPMVTIYAYSLKSNGSKSLSANFTVKEFACHDGSDTIMIAPALVMLLQNIRAHYGKAVSINSGYRTAEWNKKNGGVAESQHTYGTAADIHISGVTPAALAAYVETLMPNTGGIGIYSAFTHVDVREVKARWNG